MALLCKSEKLVFVILSSDYKISTFVVMKNAFGILLNIERLPLIVIIRPA
jgi:hypothetical protein